MTYLMMSLEELFDIIAFADQLHSEVEARNLMLDLMLEAFAAYPFVMNLTAVATESETSIAAVVAVAVIVTAALELVTD
jgi:hypothetical protein